MIQLSERKFREYMIEAFTYGKNDGYERNFKELLKVIIGKQKEMR